LPITDSTTRSETLRYADGLIDVYGGGHELIMLTVRREPHDVYEMRNIEMTAAQAREVAAALNRAADAADANGH